MNIGQAAQASGVSAKMIRYEESIGLPMERIRLLVSLWRDSRRDVTRLASQHVAGLRAEIAELTERADALQALADGCRGDGRPDCPILDDLAAFG